MKKIENLLFNIFLIIGLVMLVIGISVFSWFINIKNNGIETKAIITDLAIYYSSGGSRNRTRSTDTYIQYFVEGKEYNTIVHYYVSGMQIGDEITVYCKRDNPAKVYTNGTLIFPSIISFLGVVFFLIGFIVRLIKGSKKRLKARLVENGKRIYADISEITVNRSYRINGRSPYNIICQWNDISTGMVYLFRSSNIWYNPKTLIEDRQIKQLPVYLDENNYKKYYVGIDELEDKVQDLT